jgi:hypothetical protein
VQATRVSDSQINLSWNQNSPSNGQPQTNDIIYSVNNGAWNLPPNGNAVTINAARSTTLGAAPNQKIFYQVRAWNSGAGASGWSESSNTVYTTPAAPSNARAVKGTDLGITVSFTKNVAYSEHNHEVWHGVSTNGSVDWDSAPLATLASGVTSYKHAAPDASQVHVYRVRAKAGNLYSGYASTSSVQLLVAPNKPTVPSVAYSTDKAKSVLFAWIHNPVDTTDQTAYEFQVSENGGLTWGTSGKVYSDVQARTIPANTYAADVVLSTRVRTWGSANTGGSEGTGASPWSNTRSVTFKTAPTTTVTAPAPGSTINDSNIRVSLGFTQPEGAKFVKAEVSLFRNGALLEKVTSGNQVGISLDTVAKNGQSYTVQARAQDSNGIWSALSESTFSVTYLPPVSASVVASYLPESGYGQLNLTIADPAEGESPASTFTITRTINGVAETIVKDYPAELGLGIIDTTPTIHGTNIYTVTTSTALGATATTTAYLITEECRRAFLSKGATYSTAIVFGGNLEVSETLGVATDTLQASGRLKPIGLYGVETSVQLKVSSLIFAGFGSNIDAVRDLLLVPGKACYRDPSGRRVFGSVKGSVKYEKTTKGNLSFTLTETS